MSAAGTQTVRRIQCWICLCKPCQYSTLVVRASNRFKAITTGFPISTAFTSSMIVFENSKVSENSGIVSCSQSVPVGENSLKLVIHLLKHMFIVGWNQGQIFSGRLELAKVYRESKFWEELLLGLVGIR